MPYFRRFIVPYLRSAKRASLTAENCDDSGGRMRAEGAGRQRAKVMQIEKLVSQK